MAKRKVSLSVFGRDGGIEFSRAGLRFRKRVWRRGVRRLLVKWGFFVGEIFKLNVGSDRVGSDGLSWLFGKIKCS